MKLGSALLIIFLFFSCAPDKDSKFASWEVTGGSKENIRYSTIDQIDTANVKDLQVAWEYYSGDADTVRKSQIQCNPIMVDGTLYITSPQLRLIALDAATGKEKWVFNPHALIGKDEISKTLNLNNNRGVTWWSDGVDKRILYTVGPSLFAVEALTGQLIKSFGREGRVELHEGLGRNVDNLYIASTSPGIIFKDLIILGSRVAEESNAAPGHIRAFDVRTGEQMWIFHTIPHPGEFGFDTWEDSTAYRNIGGANSWSGFSLDEKRGILFAPTGSASYDFYGGKRKGAGLFANCVLALDAATGKYIWHYQTVHHDTWDMDHPTAPCLITIQKDGNSIDVVAQATKSGFVFLLDRETGKPVYPIEERPVSTTTELKGEQLWPTQPFPTFPKSFMRQSLTVDELNNLVPDSSYEDLKKRFLSYNTGGMFIPMSTKGTVVFPGLDGGAEWGGSAFDPATGLLYVNANEMPWILFMKEKNYNRNSTETYLTAGKRLYDQNCLACHGADRKGSGNFPSILDSKSKYNKKALDDLLTSGRRMMPGFQALSRDERDAIASFILDLKNEQTMKFNAEPAVIDSFRNLPYSVTGYYKFLSREGYPGIKPPWGTLNAINLSTGEIEWKVTLGEYPEFKTKGIITGTENYGGPVVTSSGLVFIGATRDSKFRVFNKWTGKLLWETTLPAAGFATPAVYHVNGKQFVVIACGGGKLNTTSSDAYVAFALPE